MDHFYSEYPAQMTALASETARPGVYKMYKRLETNPRIRAYIAGGRWEYRPASPLINFYSAGVIVSDWERGTYRNALLDSHTVHLHYPLTPIWYSLDSIRVLFQNAGVGMQAERAARAYQ